MQLHRVSTASRLLALLCLLTTGQHLFAQSHTAAEPFIGIRENPPAQYALVGGTVITTPGYQLDTGTVLIDRTAIIAVGSNLEVPNGFKIIDCEGLKIYPGLIDAYSETDVAVPSDETARHWNTNITPESNTAAVAVSSIGSLDQLHSQGITARLVAPSGGIIKGSSSVVLVSNNDSGRALLKPRVWNHLTLTVPRQRTGSRYPNSPMGATALVRQTFYDTQWYEQAWRTYGAKPTLAQPELNVSLQRLAEAVPNEWFVFDAANERMALRAHAVANEFSLKAILRGSGREYRDAKAIADAGRPILVPLNFPSKPQVESVADARKVDLRDLLHWDLAPSNPAVLVDAGVTICLTTDGLDSPGDFLQQVRIAVENGLSSDDALAALTTMPAKLMSLEDQLGTIQPGKLANLVVTDGDLFSEETRVMQTWVAGAMSEVTTPESRDALAGKWKLQAKLDDIKFDGTLTIESDSGSLSGVLEPNSRGGKNKKEKPEKSNEDPNRKKKKRKPRKDSQKEEADDSSGAKLSNITRSADRLTAQLKLAELGDEYPSGTSGLTLVTIEESKEELTILGTLSLPSGQIAKLTVSRATEKKADEQDAGLKQSSKPDEGSDDSANAEAIESQADGSSVETLRLYPLGAFGRDQPISEAKTVMFQDATLWTCEEAGILKEADILIEDGVIRAIGNDLAVPEGCQVIDAWGKHISPGLIDCHSHMGTDGGVNESGQVVTAEVRIGDFIDNTDINIYRQLAGGLTTANILHGSANPIGGQNQVIKLRWGGSMNDLRMIEAPAGIKFALGENVKRNPTRYPNTRMGVQQIFRDQFLAAREYAVAWRDWRAGKSDRLPPRVDLQLQALAEIQRGERWIHCHSYRQDEITATLDVLEEFGIRIGTLQHILEGYKVADRMAKHGAMASAFSDWWAYKFEVYDAIPHNGALMHQQGVTVSFNSDDRELARRMNTEAAKAVKYGGVSEAEALKFVTLNPAKQLRIDKYTGSLKPGKHADLVLWSGSPLSTLARCEQTWIDGQKYFDLATDAKLRLRDRQLHASLVQKVLNEEAGSASTSAKPKQTAEEDRWAKHDIYCGAHGSSGHVHSRWEQRK